MRVFFIIFSFFLLGCNSGSLISDEDLVREDILVLANKYGIKIEFTNYKSSEKVDEISLQDLERLFVTLNSIKEKPLKSEILFDAGSNKCSFTTRKKNVLPRLKSGLEECIPTSGYYGDSEWYYNATWFNVDVSWTGYGSNINISSNFLGVSMWSYNQTQCSYTQSGCLVSYNICGTATLGVGVSGTGVNITNNVHAYGVMNICNGQGSIILD